MDAGSLVLLRKHAVYLCIAAWRIITHFHIVVPWALVPVILAFRVPYIEPIEFDLKSVMVSKLPECTNYSFSTAVQKVRTSCADSKAEPPIEYNETTHPKSFDPKRQAENVPAALFFSLMFLVHQVHGILVFPIHSRRRQFHDNRSADSRHFTHFFVVEPHVRLQAGSGARGKLTDYEFSDSHSWTSLLESKTIQDGVIFGEYLGIVSFLISMCVVGAIFFMMREYFRWDTFVLRSPALASCIAAARVATTMFLIFKAFQKFLYIRPLLAAAGSIACSIIILIPVSIVASRLPQGRLSSLFSYTTRIACTGIAVPVVWHVIFVENVINPVAGPVFTDSTPSTVMTCFWFVGAIVGLMLHSSMDKQVRHMAPALNQQGLLFALEALRFTFVYASVEFLLSFLVVVLGNFSEIVLGEFGDFNPSLIGRMFFATAFCTFITWTGAQYVAACLDPHPSCSLSISDARLLADGSTSSLYTGHAAYRCTSLLPLFF